MRHDVDIAALARTADLARRDRAILHSLVSRSWPAPSDSTQPVGREWVRRWRPARLTAEPPDCVCSVGRCGWCN